MPELGALGVTDWREVLEGPWRVLYRVAPGVVSIEGVLDSRRDLAELLVLRGLGEL